MNMVSVTSSNLDAVAYDSATQELQVRFKGGKVWSYAGVPAEAHAELMKAESIGKHFGTNIRGKFESKAVDALEKVDG